MKENSKLGDGPNPSEPSPQHGMTREQCEAVLDAVAEGMSLTRALAEFGKARADWRRAKKRWPDLVELYEIADSENAEWMFDDLERPLREVASGKMELGLAKELIATRMWRLKTKHWRKFGGGAHADVTSGGEKLPAARVFHVGIEVVDKIRTAASDEPDDDESDGG